MTAAAGVSAVPLSRGQHTHSIFPVNQVTLRSRSAKRRYLWGILGLAITAISLYSLLMLSSSRERNPTVAELQRAVFTVIGRDAHNDAISQGSGFFIDSNGTGITNFHVLKGSSQAEIRLENGTKYSIARVLAANEEIDLIAFKVNIPSSKVASVIDIKRAAQPTVGQHIFAIGSPKGFNNTVSDGLVSAIREVDGMKVIQITAPMSPGSSGGAVIDDRGVLVGVTSFQAKSGQNLNFAIAADHVRSLLDREIGTSFTSFASSLRVTRSENTTQLHDDVADVFNAGVSAMNTGKYSIALQLLKRAEKMTPDDVDILYNLGACYEALGQEDEAILYYYRYLSKSPTKDEFTAHAEAYLSH
jgi:serine protease Do